MNTIHGISVDYSKDSLFDELGLKRLKESYMKPEENSPQERFAFVAKTFGTNKKHSQRIYNYISNHWLSLATPILSFGRNNNGLPISCFLSWMDDSKEGLVNTLSETNWLSMLGGGIGIGIGIRSSDNKSTGVMSHLKIYDAACLAYKQGSTRRGSYAVYLDISHPDIIPFLEIRKPTGDQNLRCLNLHHGINITDKFMEIIEKCMLDKNADDSWELIDPASNEIKEIVSAKMLWEKILELRMMTGEPYFTFIDEANRKLPIWLKEKGLKIRQSNLCNEIMLPTDETRTAVCCLSSLNLEYYDDWKNNEIFIHDVVEMLDNVLTYFIEHAPKEISRAIYSAKQERSIGVGTLGFHTYLQKNMKPFEGWQSKGTNLKIFKYIFEKLDEANKKLAIERGEAPDAKGTGNRFSHVSAIAPNASSSIIMGNASPSVEPFRANCYRQDTLSGSFFAKNKFLDELIKEKIKENDKLDYDEIWSSIISNDGSVQHLTCLDENEKEIFKTAMEINQQWIIELAADRQQFIDQGQSINLFFRPDVNIKYLHAVHFLAWKKKLKGLYYCRSEKIGKADKISKKIERNIIKEIDLKKIATEEESCLVCQ